jgi:hypothetical protein
MSETDRPCYVLVLAAGATNVDSALRYAPLGKVSLEMLFADARSAALKWKSLHGALDYDRYDVFRDFFFGMHVESGVIEALRATPSALVDCGIYATESDGVHDIPDVLKAFGPEEKDLFRIGSSCADGQPSSSGWEVSSETQFETLLAVGLRSHPFRRLLEKTAR